MNKSKNGNVDYFVFLNIDIVTGNSPSIRARSDDTSLFAEWRDCRTLHKKDAIYGDSEFFLMKAGAKRLFRTTDERHFAANIAELIEIMNSVGVPSEIIDIVASEI
jgi:hypothetical protein